MSTPLGDRPFVSQADESMLRPFTDNVVRLGGRQYVIEEVTLTSDNQAAKLKPSDIAEFFDILNKESSESTAKYTTDASGKIRDIVAFNIDSDSGKITAVFKLKALSPPIDIGNERDAKGWDSDSDEPSPGAKEFAAPVYGEMARKKTQGTIRPSQPTKDVKQFLFEDPIGAKKAEFDGIVEELEDEARFRRAIENPDEDSDDEGPNLKIKPPPRSPDGISGSDDEGEGGFRTEEGEVPRR